MVDPWFLSELPELLRCTRCHGEALSWAIGADSRRLDCSCGAGFPMTGNVVWMGSRAPDEDTLKKFEHQWEIWGGDEVVFGKDAAEFQERYFREFANPRLSPSWFPNKLVLDAGCGHGIMVEVFHRLGARAIGLELGRGILQAARRLAGKPVILIQGDILDLPFRADRFDYVYSNGVLHHTRDPRRALLNLASLLKPGGGLDVWLYPRKGALWEGTMAVARSITTRLPARVLSKLVYALVPLLYVVPTFSRTSPRTHTIRQCAQVIYDWLSPRYQSHHTLDEVALWYREGGMVEVGQVTVTPLTVHGVKR